MNDRERSRLDESRRGTPWKRWGPYLSERQWGTVREDYSEDGDAWRYFSHDQARSRAYRWGEDGLAGICDDEQRLCFSLAMWNGRDPILKERLFGLTNSEGNHGEDVKEYYFYLDSTPTHSYMRYLYRYPQAAYPYDDLVATNRGRSRHELEYELLDTGVFDEDRYFDVVVEYAKADPETIAVRLSAHNRGPDPAVLDLLPMLWFRNTWSWGDDVVRPSLRRTTVHGRLAIRAEDEVLGPRDLLFEGTPEMLFTQNETNLHRLAGAPDRSAYVKDAFHDHLIHERTGAVDPTQQGTKAALWYRLPIPAKGSSTVRLLLTDGSGTVDPAHVDGIIEERKLEADEFYAAVLPPTMDADAVLVARQALAGMLWSKQHYRYDVDRWLEEHGAAPFGSTRSAAPRNGHWHHMSNADVISMPDKWEYPWYAAWDLAFHVLALGMVDEDLAKQQLELMVGDDYLHPNGQLPAYEWDFGDVNPPVHAWATIFTYRLEQASAGRGDVEWLERMFQRLLLNFTWWVNRKDRTGSNLFEGGFLGMDNIGVFDRSAPLPMGGYLEQADGTAWMALFSQNMLEIAAELALERPVYADMATKFVEHFLWIATSMMQAGDGTGMWDEEDGFFYDVLRLPDGSAQRLRVRSMVGLLPIAAATVFEGELLRRQPELGARMRRFLAARPELRAFIHDPALQGEGGRRLASILDETKLRRVLGTMLDEAEFLSAYGIRSVSLHHLEHPYELEIGGVVHRVGYAPAESDDGMFGGNSNWRGPIWMPVNVLLIRALIQYHAYFGDRFRIECPTGSGHEMSLYEVAEEIGRRLSAIFLKDAEGHRPVFGGARKFRDDAAWRDTLLFYEYFHGENGAGLGASHQTGWTGVIARVMQLFASLSAEEVVAGPKLGQFEHVVPTNSPAAVVPDA